MNNFIEGFNHFSSQWFEIFAGNSLQIAVLFVIIYLLAVIFRRKSATFLYAIWLTLLVKAVLIPRIRLPFFGNRVIDPVSYMLDAVPVALSPAISNRSGIHLPISSVLFLIWLAGIVILMLIFIHNERKFNRLLRNARPFEAPDAINRIAQKMGVRVAVRVLISEEVPAPFTRGYRKAVIYLPSEARGWNPQQLNHVLSHELAHLKRRDFPVILFQNALNVLYFFHPLVWAANFQVNFQREKICDDLAISVLGEKPATYGRTLLQNLESLFVKKHVPLIANGLLFSKKVIVRRFEYLFNRREEIMLKLSAFQKVLVIALIATAVILSCSRRAAQSVRIPEDAMVFSEITVTTEEGKELVPYDEPPLPVGGFKAIQANLVYPEKALQAGIEGTIVVQFYVDENGKIGNCTVLKGLPGKGLDDAAVEAIRKTAFQPARQGGQNVGATIAVPVLFQLSTEHLKSAHPKPEVKFVKYDEPPVPIGGFKAIQESVVYPKAAWQTGIEGTVIVQAFINKRGKVKKCAILRGVPNTGLDEAAMEAIRKTSFEPARRGKKKVGVYISVPVIFKAKEIDSASQP